MFKMNSLDVWLKNTCTYINFIRILRVLIFFLYLFAYVYINISWLPWPSIFGSISLFICFVCYHHYSKSYERIAIIFYGGSGVVIRIND